MRKETSDTFKFTVQQSPKLKSLLRHLKLMFDVYVAENSIYVSLSYVVFEGPLVNKLVLLFLTPCCIW